MDRDRLAFVAAYGCEAWHDLDQWVDCLEAGRVDRGWTQLKVLFGSLVVPSRVRLAVSMAFRYLYGV